MNIPEQGMFCDDYGAYDWKECVSIDITPEGYDIYPRLDFRNNGIPEDIWAGRRLRFDFEPGTDRTWVEEMLADNGELTQLLQFISDGMSIDNDNRGSLTEDALDATWRLESLLEEAPRIPVYDIVWAMGYDHDPPKRLLEFAGLTADSTDADIKKAAIDAYARIELTVEFDAWLAFDATDIEGEFRQMVKDARADRDEEDDDTE